MTLLDCHVMKTWRWRYSSTHSLLRLLVGGSGSTVFKALCYTNLKVAGSIPDGVIRIFH